MSTARLEIIEQDYHRNGIAGVPFRVALIDDPEDGRMVAVQFNSPQGCFTAVLNVEKLCAGDVAFGSNSWRGDVYAERLARLGFKPGEAEVTPTA